MVRALLALALVAGVVGAPIAASAAVSPPTPTTTQSAQVPTITAPSGGYFSNDGAVSVRGTAAPGARVTVAADGTDVASATAGDNGRFSAEVSGLSSGTNIPITARSTGTDGVERTSSAVGIDVLTAPTITAQTEGIHTGLIRGTGFPGATVTLTFAGVDSWTTPVQSSGRWAYSVPASLHGTFTAYAAQSAPFSSGSKSVASEKTAITIDNRPPSAPRILHPRAGEQLPLVSTFSGTGENGAIVTVYTTLESGHSGVLCSTSVVGTGWSCEVTAPAVGVANISAYQTDSSGNPGTGTEPMRVEFVAGTPGPPASPGPSASPRDPHVTTPAPDAALPAPPSVGMPRWMWTEPSPYSAVKIPMPSVDGARPWLLAFAVALGVIALVLAPARMLAGSVATGRRWRFTGRNSARMREDEIPAISDRVPWLPGLASLAITALVVMLAMPLSDSVGTNVRLYLVTLLAVALVNTASVALPMLTPSHVPVAARTVEMAPRYLLAAVLTSLVSRTLHLSPALVFGLAVAIVLAEPVSRVDRGRSGLLRITGIFLIGVLGWVGAAYAATAVASEQSLLHVLLAEFSSVMAMAGIGSAAILLIPLGRTSGRAVLGWSPLIWLGTALVVYTALFGLILPGVIDRVNTAIVAPLTIAAVLFGAVSLATFLWKRVVTPALSEEADRGRHRA